MPTVMLRLPEVIRRTKHSKATIWRKERAGEFPHRRRTGENSVAWVEAEIEEYLAKLEPVQLADRPTVEAARVVNGKPAPRRRKRLEAEARSSP